MIDYIFIRAWGHYMGSMAYYIRDQLDIAREDKAPFNAIYKDDDGFWRTIEDIKDPLVRDTVDKLGAEIKRRSSERTII